jgi:predicted Rossmann fold flavoprotein
VAGDPKLYDVIVIGAGAAGLMCAIEAGKRGQKVLVIDHAKRIGEKIRISGGGRCNFTNLETSPKNFLSSNPHFFKSALKQFDQWSFIDMVAKHAIAYHEKTLGQLFCDGKSVEIIDMLLTEASEASVVIKADTEVSSIAKTANGFSLSSTYGELASKSLVVACGGKSIPKIGATGFGYQIASQFGHELIESRPGLVPLTFTDELLEFCRDLAGLSVDAVVSFGKVSFREGLLFTHRGLSGPSILQISSYWREGSPIQVNLTPGQNLSEALLNAKLDESKVDLVSFLSRSLPKRLAVKLAARENLSGRLAEISDKKLRQFGELVNCWNLVPAGTEGYRTAEVTLGGVNTDQLLSNTMESKLTSGLFFIGEVVDVTGHLGGFNFQWAWSSGWVAGQHA